MKEYIQSINASISNRLPKHLEVDVFELAEPILIRDEEDRMLPCIRNGYTGDCAHVLDEADGFDLVIYHKLNGKTFIRRAASGYGDRPEVTCVCDLSLLVFGKSAKADMYDIETQLEELLSMQKDVELQSADFNSVQVWGAEYTGVPYYLDPQFFLFRINYRLSTSLLTGCKHK